MRTITLWRVYRADVPRSSDEWSSTDRGWLFETHGSPDREDWTCLGHYLDYGRDHYRSPHEYCSPDGCTCRRSQPGNVHAVVTRGDRPARYFRTPAEARAWIAFKATGQLPLLTIEGR